MVPILEDERMSLDVDTLTSQSDVSVKSAVAQSSHEGSGTVVHPGEELSTATLSKGSFLYMFFHDFSCPTRTVVHFEVWLT